ncbi:copper resistance CopC family protein [Lysinibacter sp. HNR]|uniref:copper resistance CopC family protein n=1 Tax=Lysinibacter sp. HNR TaxID=3031408 RepID=UPI0024356A33|nr:copper resistance CopC family protein [Lysinibacter sp. HNR]WGD37927.1 copper resistance protein CopC [Lysinibacter sp. HNR]
MNNSRASSRGRKPLHTATRWGGVLCAALGLVTAPLAVATPAHAHDRLISSQPSDSAQIDAAPENVSLTFSDTILNIGSLIRVTDSAGKDWIDGEPSHDARLLTQKLLPGAADDTYTVAWRVVSSDGHPISGSFVYTVGTGTPERGDTTPSAVPPVGSETAPETEKTSDAMQNTSLDEDIQKSLPSVLRTLFIALLGAAIAVGLMALVLRVSRRFRASAPSSPDGTDTSAHDEAPSQKPTDPPARDN